MHWAHFHPFTTPARDLLPPRAGRGRTSLKAIPSPPLSCETAAETSLCRLAEVVGHAAVGQTPCGRGLLATKDLKKQDVIAVPLHNLLLITDTAVEGISVYGDRQHRLWQEQHGPLPQQLLDFLEGDARWDIRLTAWLLWLAKHGQGNRLWSTYCAGLPREADMSLLLNYSGEERSLLQVPAAMAESAVQRDWVEECHRDFFSRTAGRAGQGGDLRALRLADSLEDTLWAHSMARSRTFSSSVAEEHISWMAPFVDMANHSLAQTAGFAINQAAQRCELKLQRSLQAGDEICISYGDKGNFEMMRDYGFVIPANPDDRVGARIPAVAAASKGVAASSNSTQQQGMEAPGGLPGLCLGSVAQALGLPRLLTMAQVSSPRDWARLLVTARFTGPQECRRWGDDDWARVRLVLLSLRSREMVQQQRQQASPGGWGWPSAKAWTPAGEPPPETATTALKGEELQSVAVLRHRCVAELSALPTTLEADEQLLASHEAQELEQPLTTREAQAVRFRLEHKRLLTSALAVLDMYRTFLSRL